MRFFVGRRRGHTVIRVSLFSVLFTLLNALGKRK